MRREETGVPGGNPRNQVEHRVFYLDGHPSRYQPRPTGLNCGEQTGTGVFPLVIAVQQWIYSDWKFIDISYSSVNFNGGAFACLGGPGGGAFADFVRPRGRALANLWGTPRAFDIYCTWFISLKHGEFPWSR